MARDLVASPLRSGPASGTAATQLRGCVSSGLPRDRPASDGSNGMRDEADQRADVLVSLERVSKRSIAVDDIAVAAPTTPLVNVASELEVAHDSLHGTLGDSDLVTQGPDGQVRIPRDAQQDVCVV
jgi:hypothetical protein